jgi:hypothetical protein
MTTALALVLSMTLGAQDQGEAIQEPQDAVLGVGSSLMGEVDLFSRWAASRGVKTIGALTGSVYIEMYKTSQAKLDALLPEYASAFGVDFRDMVDSAPKFRFTEYVVSPEAPETAAVFFARFASDSIVRKAYEKAVKEDGFRKEEKVSWCEYVVRPWITEDGKYTERVVLKINGNHYSYVR